MGWCARVGSARVGCVWKMGSVLVMFSVMMVMRVMGRRSVIMLVVCLVR